MSFGLHHLRLTPAVFWRLSLSEWRALTTPPRGQPLGRTQFEQLMLQHPD